MIILTVYFINDDQVLKVVFCIFKNKFVSTGERMSRALINIGEHCSLIPTFTSNVACLIVLGCSISALIITQNIQNQIEFFDSA